MAASDLGSMKIYTLVCAIGWYTCSLSLGACSSDPGTFPIEVGRLKRLWRVQTVWRMGYKLSGKTPPSMFFLFFLLDKSGRILWELCKFRQHLGNAVLETNSNTLEVNGGFAVSGLPKGTCDQDDT